MWEDCIFGFHLQHHQKQDEIIIRLCCQQAAAERHIKSAVDYIVVRVLQSTKHIVSEAPVTAAWLWWERKEMTNLFRATSLWQTWIKCLTKVSNIWTSSTAWWALDLSHQTVKPEHENLGSQAWISLWHTLCWDLIFWIIQQSNKGFFFNVSFLPVHVALQKDEATAHGSMSGWVQWNHHTHSCLSVLFTVFTFGSWTKCDNKNESLKEVECSSIKTEKCNSDSAVSEKTLQKTRVWKTWNVKVDQFLRSDFQTGLFHLHGAAFSSRCLCKWFLNHSSSF